MPIHGVDNVKKAMRATRDRQGKNLRAIFLQGLNNIVLATPVDEGRARNNWFLTTGTPFSLFGRSDNKNGASSITSIRSMPNSVLNKKIYFTNNLPYIRALEYGLFPNPVKQGSYNKSTKSYEKLSSGGFSKQAKKGFVRVELLKMAKKVRAL